MALDDSGQEVDTDGLSPTGSRHYRAFVGPAARYDLIAAMQFNLLTALGLREDHFVLDIGCGSLRGGRLFIPYLLPGRYFGIEPEEWLLREGIENEVGQDLIVIKQPSFSTASDFRLTSFDREFDFLLAHSIFSHAAPAQIKRCLSEARRVMHSESLFAATYFAGAEDYQGKTWVYPGCVVYTPEFLHAAAREAGLESRELDWPHPGGQLWLLFHRPDRDFEPPHPRMKAHIDAGELRACCKHDQQLSSPSVRPAGSCSRTANPRVSAEPAVPTLESVDLSRYEFLDFGAGSGGSLVHCQKLFRAGRGLGIDIDTEKVRKARSFRREVVLGDIHALPQATSVRFVSMMDFLEHLPNLDEVQSILAVARRVARELIFIRHPSFEDEAYLNSLGLKQYWTDWTGHKAHVLLSDFSEIFHRLGITAWDVTFRGAVSSSGHPSILPIAAPPNQHDYDPVACGTKPIVQFTKPVFRQLDILAWLVAPQEQNSTSMSGVDQPDQ